MALISRVYLNNNADDLPDIRPKSMLSEVYCRKQLTSYEEYTIFPDLGDVTIGGIDRDRSNPNCWDRVHIRQKLCSQREIIESILRHYRMPKPGSVAKTKARLFPNQSALVDNIVANKNVNKYEGNQYFKWNIAQLHLDESANNMTGGMETNSITVYLKRAPRPGVDVMSLYRERQERAASKQGQQQMVTGQDTDQGKLDLVEFYYENTRINSMYNAVPQNYDNQERDGSMSPALSYNLNRQDQLNIPTTSYWTVQDQNEFPMLIERYGTDWHGIAKSTGTKTHTMIKNYYQRQVDLGHKELEEKARIADERRNRGESATPLPPQSMSQAQLQFHMTTQQQQSQNPQQTQPQKTQQQQPGINNRELREITPHEQANNAGPGAGLHQGTTRDDETLVDDPTEASATKSAANARPLRRRTKRGCLGEFRILIMPSPAPYVGTELTDLWLADDAE